MPWYVWINFILSSIEKDNIAKSHIDFQMLAIFFKQNTDILLQRRMENSICPGYRIFLESYFDFSRTYSGVMDFVYVRDATRKCKMKNSVGF